jgi:hypothetical protein
MLRIRKGNEMGLFGKKKSDYPVFSPEKYEPALRCSICTGEQVLCARERGSGKLLELMLIRDPSDLEGFCKENGLIPEQIEKIY